MNREIKFRGKRIDNGKWVYGFYAEFWIDGKKTYQIYVCPKNWQSGSNKIEDYFLNSGEWVEIEKDSIGQYTSLKDKNGEEIYEGDIVKYETYVILGERSDEPIEYTYEPVIFIDNLAAYGCKNLGAFNDTIGPISYEVVGNIYENPELLKST